MWLLPWQIVYVSVLEYKFIDGEVSADFANCYISSILNNAWNIVKCLISTYSATLSSKIFPVSYCFQNEHSALGGYFKGHNS